MMQQDLFAVEAPEKIEVLPAVIEPEVLPALLGEGRFKRLPVNMTGRARGRKGRGAGARFDDVDEFFPTPPALIFKMLDGLKLGEIETVLEPSAGRGDIADLLRKRLENESGRRYRGDSVDIDTIEIDPNLQLVLKGKEYRVVHNDFLSYNSHKPYDLVIMNPPFSQGDRHLLKALDIQRNGGKIICLLNAETIRNPYTNIRKDLVRRLTAAGAEIEYIKGAFLAAERSTDVEVALVRVTIPEVVRVSGIYENLRQQEHYEARSDEEKSVTHADFLMSRVEQYQVEVKAVAALINEWAGLKPHILSSFEESEYRDNTPIIGLFIDGKKADGSPREMINSAVCKVRYKYWRALFSSKQFRSLFTSNLSEEFHKRVEYLQHYDFSLYNIQQIIDEIMSRMAKGVEETILAMFDEFSDKYHWINESSTNLHFYNGWKTNKAHRINKRVIIPMYGAFRDWYDKRFNPTDLSQ